MADKTYTLNIDVDDKDLVNLNKEVVALDDNLEDVDEQLKKTGKTSSKEMQKMEKSTAKASKGMKGFGSSVRTAGFAMKRAFSAGILLAITAIVAAFKEVQPIVDFFNTGLTTLSLVGTRLFNIMEALVDLDFTKAREEFASLLGVWSDASSTVDARKEADLLRATYQRNRDELMQQIELNRVWRDDISKSITSRKVANESILTQIEDLRAATNRFYDEEISRLEKEQELFGNTPEREAGIITLLGEKAAAMGAINGLQADYVNNLNTLQQSELNFENELSKIRQQRLFDENLYNVFLLESADERYNSLRGLEISRFNEENQRIEERLARETLGSEIYNQILLEQEQAQNDHYNNLRTLDENYTADKYAEDQARFQNTMTTLSMGLQATGALMGALSQLSAENFEEQKKYQIAGAVINAISGSIGAYTGAFVSIPNPIAAAIVGTIAAIAVQVASFAQIQKIRSSSPGGGGGGGGGGFSAPSIGVSSAPSLSLVSPLTTGEEALAGAIGQETEPAKAYVVSEDMTSQQALDRRIGQNATI